MRYVKFDNNGEIIGLYLRGTNPEVSGEIIPSDYLQITNVQYADYINNQAGYIVDVNASPKAFIERPAKSESVLLAEAKALRKILLTNQCNTEIISGFSSSALGSDYSYKSGEKDQLDLAVSVLSGNTCNYLCSSDAGANYAYVSHTNAELKNVLSDFQAFKMGLISTLETKKTQVDNAETVNTVNAINW
jgi:hypothetical protein